MTTLRVATSKEFMQFFFVFHSHRSVLAVKVFVFVDAMKCIRCDGDKIL
jgi:hypothetical protein